MAEINYVPQVDYTSKDYVAIREDMISRISDFLPEWTSRDPADFGIVLLSCLLIWATFLTIILTALQMKRL
jgi:hypothetical protein